MNHLSDEQLVSFLYEEAEEQRNEIQGHLDACCECRARLESLQSTQTHLDRWKVPEPSAGVDSHHIVESLAGQTELRSRNGSWINGFRIHPALAASLLVLFASAGFLGGAVYQGNSMTARVDSQLEAFQASWSERQKSGLEQQERQLESRLVAFRESLEKWEINQLSQNQQVFAELLEQFDELASQHQRLRSDLQTLAVNADSEFNLAHQDIRKLNELVSFVLPTGQ